MNDLEFLNRTFNMNAQSMEDINWEYVSMSKKLTEEIIRKYYPNITIQYLPMSVIEKVSKQFFEDFKKDINWYKVSENIVMSEKFIEKYEDVVHWYNVAIYQNMSEKFIEKYYDILPKFVTICFNELSLDFIKAHNLLNDEDVYTFHKIPEEFIVENFNKLENNTLKAIFKYQKISDELKKRITEERNIPAPSFKNWLYASTEFKKKEIEKLEMYDCYDDYFIAYKAIRKNRHSIATLKYKYEKGKTYESWCDCTPTENSFGLNVGVKFFAEMYGNMTDDEFKIIKCKVKYEDVGRIVHDGEKIRCFKFEVIN